MNIQYYDGKNMIWLEPEQKYELETSFLMEAWKEAQTSNSESFFEWALLYYKKKFNLQKAIIFLGVNGFKKVCGDDILTMKSFFRFSQKQKHIIASNKISSDPRNKTKSLSGKCIQYPFILGNDVLGSIVYFRKEECPAFTADEICQIAGPYSRYISSVLLDWHNKNIKFGTEMWEFVNVMSHEIRTPLNSISGMSQLLVDSSSNFTQDQKKYINILQDANIHLMTLINDMIDYSKLQYKNITIRNESFDLNKLIEQSITILNAKHAVTHVHTSHTSGGGEEGNLLIGDKSKLLQIFINLLGNAIKYTPSSTKVLKEECDTCITINTCILFPKDGMSILEYSISDTGIGISEENIKKIFEPFFSLGGEKGGMGLGLSIVKDILTQQGGKITVESTLDVGTTFNVKIPIEIDNYFNDWYRSKKEYISQLNILLFIHDKNILQSYKKLFDDAYIKYTVTDGTPILLKENTHEGIHEGRKNGSLLRKPSIPNKKGGSLVKKKGGLLMFPEEPPSGSDGGSENSPSEADVLITDTYDYTALTTILFPLVTGKTNILNTHEVQPVRSILLPYICENHIIVAPKKDLKTLRILLVEDDPNNIFYINEVLKSFGVDSKQVTSKACQKDAMNSLDDHYDIYMLDIKLPDGTGEHVAKTIQKKKTGTVGNYQIIGMTAGAQEPPIGTFNKCITKPLRRTALAEILKEHFSEPPQPPTL